MTTLLNARILASLGMIVFVAALIVGGTGAFFSDEETSTGNTFTAGAIDLQIDNSSYGFDWNDPTIYTPTGVWGPNAANSWQLTDLTNQLFFNFVDLKPGDYGEDTISLHVNDNDSYACMAFDLTGTPENGQNEPEADVDATAGADEGELQNYLSFLFWHDDGDNVLEVGEDVIEELSGLPGTIFTGGWLPIAEGGDTPLAAETTNYVGKGWCFGTITAAPAAPAVNAGGPTVGNTGFTCTGAAGDHNDAQTDGLTVDVGFYAVQSRNNAQFSCASLPPFAGNGTSTPVVEVGADIAAYVAPSGPACDVTASSTITAAIGFATAGDTVCVPAGTYNEDVLVNKDITLAGAGSGSTNIVGQTADEAGAVVITADGATVQGFNITEAAGGVAALRISGAHSGILVNSNTLNAGSGGNALLMDGGQSNHTVSNNVINGVAGQPIAYVNGLASVNIASTNVDFTQNSFTGSGTMALGQEAGASSVTLNKFSATTGFTDVEDWGAGNNFNQNNFNDALNADVLHSENGFTGDTGTTNAENNWWGDANPADGDAGADVDFTPFAAVAFPQN